MKLFKRLKRGDYSKPVREMYQKLLGKSQESGPVYGKSNDTFQIYFGGLGEDKFFVEITREEAGPLAERLKSFSEDDKPIKINT